MITRNWLPFKIYLPDVACVVHCDGIVATEQTFTVMTEDTPENAQALDSYLATLTEEGEETKISRPFRLSEALQWKKESILTLAYHQLGIRERKLLLNLPLTKEEEDFIMLEHSQSQEI